MKTPIQKEENPREYFDNLLQQLSPEAQNCDIGYFIRQCSGPFVNNHIEGRELTIKERIVWLKGKMTEKRHGRFEPVTLTSLFPMDWEVIKNF